MAWGANSVSNYEPRFTFQDFLQVGMSLLVGAFFVGGAGLVIGLIADFAGFTWLWSSSFHFMITGGAIGGIGGAAIAIYAAVSQHDKANENTRLANENTRLREVAKREQEAAYRRNRLDSLVNEVSDVCTASIEQFEQLPSDLENAWAWAKEAKRHYANIAYSPFWHAIEQSYANLGIYNKRLADIQRLSRRYDSAKSEYREMSGPSKLPAFPVTLDAVRSTQVAETTTGKIGDIVYEAQRDPVFAQIWEQRRTTAAVVAGFANLEAAVATMAGTISTSIGSLAQAVDGVAGQTREANALSRRAADRSEDIGTQQLALQGQINARMDKAVHYLREEHLRALGVR